MISVIVCSRMEPENDLHKRNIIKTLGAGFEYLKIDNRDGKHSLCSAYNEGVKRAKGEIVVFVHEDVFFMEPGWGRTLEKKFADQSIGLVGVAGTQYLFADTAKWFAAGRPFVRGRIVHELDDGDTFDLTVFSWEKEDSEVVAVDGLFFAVRKSLFETVSFDDRLFDGFHFYDLDICMQIRNTHRLIVTWDILVKHRSAGRYDEVWKRYSKLFLDKYRDTLPVFCTSAIPDRAHRIPGENFSLKGKVQQSVLV